MTVMFVFFIMIIILWNPSNRQLLGNAIGFVLNPVIGFSGLAPAWSIFLGALIIIAISQTIRHFMTDWVTLAKNQAYMKAFNKELSEARKAQNQQRVQKLMEYQPQVMQRQMETQGQTMKPSLFTMVFFIAFITWIYAFVGIAAVRTVSLPWEPAWPLTGSAIFPYALILYFLFSMPMHQMVLNTWKYISFKRRLLALEEQSVPEVTV